ncbi:Monothiol glutaredoxin-S17 [Orobanche gracilis]
MAAPGAGTVKEVKSRRELDTTIGEGIPVILHFWASWCDASKQMDQVFSHLSTDFPLARFLRVEAEEQPDISEAYSVSAVPYFVFIKDGKIVDTLEGADPSSLANKVAEVSESIRPGEPAAPASLGMAAGPTVLEAVQEFSKVNGASHIGSQTTPIIADKVKNRLHQLVNSQPIILFMKGSPESPQCGFSQKVIDILKKERVKFGSFDILRDNEVRENWPIFPQLYCKGELLGGSDIAIAMHESGELGEVFRDHRIQIINPNEGTEPGSGKGGIFEPSSGLSEALSDRLGGLINSAPVMLFMKGNPDEPK